MHTALKMPGISPFRRKNFGLDFTIIEPKNKNQDILEARMCVPRINPRGGDWSSSISPKSLLLWRFSDAGPWRTSPQPPGPVSENPRGTNARGAGHPELHNAMRISPPPRACERLAAMPERRTGLGSFAQHRLQRRETEAYAAARGQPGARIAAIASLPGERGRGQHAGGGEDGRPLEWKRLR